jgi:hypothetical protein
MRALRLCFALFAVALVLTPSSAEAQRKRGDLNLLTRTELDEAGTTIVTARDAIRVLRPNWLNPPFGRIASSNVAGSAGSISHAAGAGGISSSVIVYIDDIRQPDVDALINVQARMIVEMRYLDQNRGVQIHGPGHEAGVIEVTTVNKKK